MRPDLLLRRILLTVAGTLFAAGAAFAAPSWNDLTSQQQALITPALKSQGGNFDQLPEPRRSALVKGADRWLGMSAAQRTTATQQFQRWQQLSTAEKISVLERRERFRKLSPSQRKALLDTQKQFLEMPADQQTELRTEFSELQPQIEGLPTQPLTPPGSPGNPGAIAPLGLPMTSLPGGGVDLPAPLLPR